MKKDRFNSCLKVMKCNTNMQGAEGLETESSGKIS